MQWRAKPLMLIRGHNEYLQPPPCYLRPPFTAKSFLLSSQRFTFSCSPNSLNLVILFEASFLPLHTLSVTENRLHFPWTERPLPAVSGHEDARANGVRRVAQRSACCTRGLPSAADQGKCRQCSTHRLFLSTLIHKETIAVVLTSEPRNVATLSRSVDGSCVRRVSSF